MKSFVLHLTQKTWNASGTQQRGESWQSGGVTWEGWFDQAARDHTPPPHFPPSISLPQSQGIKVTECNHCLLCANEENGEGWDWVTGRLWCVCRVGLIELWLGRKWHVMRRAGPQADITGVGSGWVNGAEKWLKWNLSVCKVHDVFYEVMRSEKILDRLWWKDKPQQILRNVIFATGEKKTVSGAKIRNKIILQEVAFFCIHGRTNLLQPI